MDPKAFNLESLKFWLEQSCPAQDAAHEAVVHKEGGFDTEVVGWHYVDGSNFLAGRDNFYSDRKKAFCRCIKLHVDQNKELLKNRFLSTEAQHIKIVELHQRSVELKNKEALLVSGLQPLIDTIIESPSYQINKIKNELFHLVLESKLDSEIDDKLVELYDSLVECHSQALITSKNIYGILSDLAVETECFLFNTPPKCLSGDQQRMIDIIKYYADQKKIDLAILTLSKSHECYSNPDFKNIFVRLFEETPDEALKIIQGDSQALLNFRLRAEPLSKFKKPRIPHIHGTDGDKRNPPPPSPLPMIPASGLRPGLRPAQSKAGVSAARHYDLAPSFNKLNKQSTAVNRPQVSDSTLTLLLAIRSQTKSSSPDPEILGSSAQESSFFPAPTSSRHVLEAAIPVNENRETMGKSRRQSPQHLPTGSSSSRLSSPLEPKHETEVFSQDSLSTTLVPVLAGRSEFPDKTQAEVAMTATLPQGQRHSPVLRQAPETSGARPKYPQASRSPFEVSECQPNATECYSTLDTLNKILAGIGISQSKVQTLVMQNYQNMNAYELFNTLFYELDLSADISCQVVEQVKPQELASWRNYRQEMVKLIMKDVFPRQSAEKQQKQQKQCDRLEMFDARTISDPQVDILAVGSHLFDKTGSTFDVSKTAFADLEEDSDLSGDIHDTIDLIPKGKQFKEIHFTNLPGIVFDNKDASITLFQKVNKILHKDGLLILRFGTGLKFNYDCKFLFNTVLVPAEFADYIDIATDDFYGVNMLVFKNKNWRACPFPPKPRWIECALWPEPGINPASNEAVLERSQDTKSQPVTQPLQMPNSALINSASKEQVSRIVKNIGTVDYKIDTETLLQIEQRFHSIDLDNETIESAAGNLLESETRQALDQVVIQYILLVSSPPKSPPVETKAFPAAGLNQTGKLACNTSEPGCSKQGMEAAAYPLTAPPSSQRPIRSHESQVRQFVSGRPSAVVSQELPYLRSGQDSAPLDALPSPASSTDLRHFDCAEVIPDPASAASGSLRFSSCQDLLGVAQNDVEADDVGLLSGNIFSPYEVESMDFSDTQQSLSSIDEFSSLLVPVTRDQKQAFLALRRYYSTLTVDDLPELIKYGCLDTLSLSILGDPADYRHQCKAQEVFKRLADVKKQKELAQTISYRESLIQAGATLNTSESTPDHSLSVQEIKERVFSSGETGLNNQELDHYFNGVEPEIIEKMGEQTFKRFLLGFLEMKQLMAVGTVYDSGLSEWELAAIKADAPDHVDPTELYPEHFHILLNNNLITDREIQNIHTVGLQAATGLYQRILQQVPIEGTKGVGLTNWGNMCWINTGLQTMFRMISPDQIRLIRPQVDDDLERLRQSFQRLMTLGQGIIYGQQEPSFVTRVQSDFIETLLTCGRARKLGGMSEWFNYQDISEIIQQDSADFVSQLCELLGAYDDGSHSMERGIYLATTLGNFTYFKRKDGDVGEITHTLPCFSPVTTNPQNIRMIDWFHSITEMEADTTRLELWRSDDFSSDSVLWPSGHYDSKEKCVMKVDPTHFRRTIIALHGQEGYRDLARQALLNSSRLENNELRFPVIDAQDNQVKIMVMRLAGAGLHRGTEQYGHYIHMSLGPEGECDIQDDRIAQPFECYRHYLPEGQQMISWQHMVEMMQLVPAYCEYEFVCFEDLFA